MIRHIVAWNYREELPEAEKRLAGQRIKAELESLQGEIEGIILIKVLLQPLETSHRQILLDSLFRSKEDLERYQRHSAHRRVSDYVGTVASNRVCMDFPET